MIIKNNNNQFNVKSNSIQYSINEFFNLEMFKPINDKKYFSNYNFKKFINKSYRVHVFGMGGSSLSCKLLAQFIDPKLLNTKIFIYDNPSLTKITQNFENLKIDQNDRFIFISKSGNTIETKYFLHLIIQFFKNFKIKNYFKQFIFITEKNESYLYKFSIQNKIDHFEHDPNIGGRFSIFSITALLPLIVAGLSLNNILFNFNIAKKNFIKIHSKVAKTIQTTHQIEKKKNLNLVVGLTYHDKLHAINEWYRQIFAESLGKNKKAINYISSYGSIDQHSQFQLYIDGPIDKHFIFFSIENKPANLNSPSRLILGSNLLSNLEQGAIKTLKQSHFLVNQFIIKEKFEDYICLCMALIFDIYLRAKIEKINFLDQPAVEILKKNTKI